MNQPWIQHALHDPPLVFLQGDKDSQVQYTLDFVYPLGLKRRPVRFPQVLLTDGE